MVLPLTRRDRQKYSLALRRFKAYAVLGGKCARCGNDDPMVLEFNHKNGDGKEHRLQLGTDSGTHMAAWVAHNPEEARSRLELLCANCHTRSHSVFNATEGYSQRAKRK